MAVRRESVEIHVSSNLPAVAGRDAALVKGLANTYDSLEKSGTKVDRSSTKVASGLDKTAKAADGADKSARRADASINQLTGRLRLLGDVAAILGPALVPIGALAVPAVAGLANQLGFATAAAGTAILAFQGVGDAVTAMNEYAFAPTEANALKVEEALAKLSPAAQDFAMRVGEMRDELLATRDAAATGLFSELTPAMDDFEGLLGRVQPVLQEIGSATGAMLADGLESLNSDRWQPFFDFLQSEARPVLMELGATVGDFGMGLADLWMTFQPLNRDFSGWIRDVASSFSSWSAGLSETQGLADFMQYLRQSGPQVADAMGALGSALAAIVTAATPLGGPALAAIEAFSNAISAIARSDIGTPILQAVAALALFNRAMAVARSASTGFAATRANFASLSTSVAGLGPGATGAASGFKSLAKEAGAAALIMGTISKGFEVYDIASRGFAASSQESANSVEDLAYKMGETNLGKYASDFGIDLNRLSDDLTRYGTDGEYYAQVSKRLTDEIGTGWSVAAKGALSGLSPVTTQFEKANMAQRALEGIVRKNTDLIGAGADVADGAAGANDGYASATERAAAAADAARANVNGLAQAMRTQTAEALGAFDAQTAWGQAVADAQAQAAAGTKGLNEMTDAGRANRTALSGLAATWNQQGREVKNNVGEYRQARQTFLDTADAMGVGRGRARELAAELLDMPRSVIVDFRMQQLARGAADAVTLGVMLGDINGQSVQPNVALRGVPGAVRSGAEIGLMPGQLDSTTARPTLDANNAPARGSVNAITGAFNRYNSLRPNPSLNANNRPATGSINAVSALIRRYDGLSPSPTLGVTDRASGTIGMVQGMLAGLRDKNITITTTYKSVRVGVGVGAAAGIRRAGGGMVTGPGTETSDSIPAMLSNREYVQRAAAVRYYGQGLMDDLNNMRIPRAQLERSSMLSAMRSGAGRVSVSAGGTFRARLDLPDGRQIDMDLIDQRVDSRIQDWNDSADDFANDLSGRSADL